MISLLVSDIKKMEKSSPSIYRDVHGLLHVKLLFFSFGQNWSDYHVLWIGVIFFSLNPIWLAETWGQKLNDYLKKRKINPISKYVLLKNVLNTRFLIEAHFVDSINCSNLHLSSLFLCTCQFSQDFVIVLHIAKKKKLSGEHAKTPQPE